MHAEALLTAGRHTVTFTFEPERTGGGRATLALDGGSATEGVIERFTPAVFNEVGIGLTCGYEWGPAVGEGYSAPFEFDGIIERAEVTTLGPPVVNPALEIAAILSKQ